MTFQVTTATSTALLIAYLLDEGYELWVSDEPGRPPSVVKWTEYDHCTEYRCAIITADDVLDVRKIVTLRLDRVHQDKRGRVSIYRARI